MRGMISLANDNHVDNNLKDILVNVYYGSTVTFDSKCILGPKLPKSGQGKHFS